MFSPITYQLDFPVSSSVDGGVDPAVNGVYRLLKAVAYGPLKGLLGSNDVSVMEMVME